MNSFEKPVPMTGSVTDWLAQIAPRMDADEWRLFGTDWTRTFEVKRQEKAALETAGIGSAQRPDGAADSIFPKVSRLDTVYGRVNMRRTSSTGRIVLSMRLIDQLGAINPALAAAVVGSAYAPAVSPPLFRSTFVAPQEGAEIAPLPAPAPGRTSPPPGPADADPVPQETQPRKPRTPQGGIAARPDSERS
jgi:hypothetical protein